MCRHSVRFRQLVWFALPWIATPIQSQSPFDAVPFRNIGPASLGGRIHDVEALPHDASTVYVATASGGIWKSVNKGITWAPILDRAGVNTFGDLAIFEGDPNIVWAGSGEQNNRQSTSWGNGIYRSSDAGLTWTHLGLDSTRHIGRVRLHPTDPAVAYVAALGNLWAPSVDRGVFKTTDGGKSWRRSLFVDSLTGAVDLVMDPGDPNVLYAAAYQRLRTPWGFNGGGPGSGIYKTMDGGATWRRLTNGLPDGDIGRIGLAVAETRPGTLNALVEHASDGGTYRTEDGGETWTRVSRQNPRPMYYSHIYIDPTNDRRVWILAEPILKSEDGGSSWRRMPTSPTYDVGLHSDFHAMWIDPRDPRHFYLAGDGGLAESFDLGETYARFSNLPIAQVYGIGADTRDPYWISIGLQDNHSWMGPSATRHWLGILNSDWLEIGFGDGMQQQPDPFDRRVVYTSGQNGSVTRFDAETGDRLDIQPRPAPGDSAYRFDWTAPMLASRHTPGTFYLGGNRLFITRDRGLTWTRTEDLTRQIQRDTLRIMGVLGKDIRLSKHDGESSFGELTTIAESPLDPMVLWIGTDDGNVKVSRDGGRTWLETSSAIPDVPNGTLVSRVVASSAGRGAALVAFDGHRSGDFAPYVFRTTDFGRSWTRVTSGLPGDEPVRSLHEYPGVARVLFAGTERGLYVSLDSARRWFAFGSNLPTTRYDDILVHPRTRDLILGTHGRSVWVLDDASFLATLASGSDRAAIAAPRRATIFQYWQDYSYLGASAYHAPNPADGAIVTYRLQSGVREVSLDVLRPDGRVVRNLPISPVAGIGRVNWDLRHEPPPSEPDTSEAARLSLPRPTHEIGDRGPFVSPGRYLLRLAADGDTVRSAVDVVGDPKLPITLAQYRDREAFLLRVLEKQQRVAVLLADLAARRARAMAARDAATDGSSERAAAQSRLDRVVALERTLRIGQSAIRGRLNSLAADFNGAGAQQGSLYPPTRDQRRQFQGAIDDLARVERELAAMRP
ncbi:MAG: Ycf48-like protein [Gemmatimonadaceae bacterium]|nr:Ycf48-like protein [Gemmatimonadaceae bacterium]